MMPKQKPHRSRQTYATPPEFIQAVKKRLEIEAFAHDFAADATNAKAENWFDEEVDALSVPDWGEFIAGQGWGWLNPPFTAIGPWAKRCMETGMTEANIALLVPAAVGSNWFKSYVDGQAHVLLLNGRIAFDPSHPTWGYPKDCILCLYGPTIVPTYEVWRWK